MKPRLARLWPLWLFLAAVAVALCALAPALPQMLVLQGPDGYANLTRPGLWRRAAEWICRGTPCLNHDELLKLLLPSLVWHEWSYAVSAGLVALGVGLYLRLVGLPVAACFGGGLAMAFSGYHFTLFNAGHRGYASMVAYAALMLPLLESAVARPRAAWAAFPLLGVCAVCGLATQPDVMVFLLLLEIAYGVFRIAQLARAEGARAFLAPRWKAWLAGLLLAIAAFGAFGWSTMRHVFGEVVAGRVAQMEAGGAKEVSAETAAADPEAAKSAARERWIFATNWSLPPEDMAEFVAPNLRGYDTGFASAPYWGRIGQSEDWGKTGQGFANFRQHSIYLGALGVAIALFAVVGAFCDLRRRAEDGAAQHGAPGLALFWAGAAIVALLLALGRFGFLYRLFYHLPMMDKVRAPLKFVHLAEVCVSVLFAFGLARLARESGRRERLAAKISIVLLAVGGLALAAASFGFDPAAHAPILAAVGAPAGSAAARELARLYGAGAYTIFNAGDLITTVDLGTVMNVGQLTTLQNQINSLLKPYNKVKNATANGVMNRVNNYLNNVTAKIMAEFENQPAWKLTEPTLLFESQQGINRMYPFSDADGSYTFEAGKYTFIMTSMTEEYIVPVYRKYIALIYGGKVKQYYSLAGNEKIVQLDIPNEACEIVYQTSDYYGNVVTKRYPINRK